MQDDVSEGLTPTKLSQAAGISLPYAWQIMKGKRTPPQAMAIKIFRSTGCKFGPIADASDDEIAVLERFLGAA